MGGTRRDHGARRRVRRTDRLVVAALTAVVLVAAACVPFDPPTPAAPLIGPGIGGVEFNADEVFEPAAMIHHDQGVPFPPFPLVKRFGMNVVTMLNGYMVGVFAPDSGGGPGGFLVYDLGDPRRPVLVKRVYDPFDTTSRFREPHSLPAARIGDRQVLAVPVVDGIELWDFTDVRDPRPISHLQLYGIAGGDYFDAAWQLSWQAPYLYVAASNHGVFIVDTTDPNRPRLANRGAGRPNPVPVSELGGFRVGPVFAFGNQLVVSSMDNQSGFANLDLSDPLNPVLVSQSGTSPQFYASCFDGRQVFLAVESPAAVAAYDVAAPRSNQAGLIAPAGASANSDESKYCARKDELLLSGNQNSVSVHDVSDTASIREVGRGSLPIEDPDHGQVTPLGHLAYVGNDHGTGNGLMPIDARPDRRPPNLDATSPRDGETDVSPGTSIGLAFGDNVALDSVDRSAIELAPIGGAPVPFTASSWLGMVSVTPDDPLAPDTTYELRILAGGVRDVAGNAVAASTVVRFSTGATVAEALAVTASPARGETGGDVTFRVAGGVGPFTWEFSDGSAPVVTAEPVLVRRFTTAAHRRITVRAATLSGGPAFGAVSVTSLRPRRWATPPVSSSTVAIAGALSFVANRDSRSVAAVSTETGQKLWETEVGDRPGTLTVDDVGHVWVTVQGEDQIVALDSTGAVVRRITLRHGAAPYGIAPVPGQSMVAVATEGDGRVITVDASNGQVRATAIVGVGARGVAVSGDGADLFVTRFRVVANPVAPQSGAPATVYRLTVGSEGQLGSPGRIELPVDTITVDGEDRARGVANYLEQIVISPDGFEAWVPSKKDNLLAGRFRDGTSLTPETTVRSLVTRLGLGADVAPVGAIDVNDRAAARAVAFTPDGDYAFVAHMESNQITIVDAYSGEPVGALPGVGRAPVGLAVDAAGTRLVVNDLLDRTITRYDISAVAAGVGFSPVRLGSTRVIASELLSTEELAGKRVFYDASDPRMTSHNYVSCASCHQDGDSDGQVWDFTQRGEGLRSTPPLFGLSGAGSNRLHFSANFDELQDFENDIRAHFGGRGFLSDPAFAATSNPLGEQKVGRSTELDALATYVRSLSAFPRSAARDPDGSFPAEAEAGRTVFGLQGCATCHSGPTMTDGKRHDVGTVDTSSGMVNATGSRVIDTPTLRGVGLSAPYFHNGSATDLGAVLDRGHGITATLSPADRSALIRYLETIEDGP